MKKDRALRWKIRTASCILVLAFGASGAFAQSAGDPLKSGFENPPNGARPRVWWHWLNGNITKEGIQLDLEWMHRAGLGGFQNFDASLMTPQVVDHRLVYMTPEWKESFLFATKLADQLGLEEAIAGSPGWSETGGPWVPPAQAMKKLVWSETRVQGGTRFHGILPKPPANAGPFQNVLPAVSFTDPNPKPIAEFYVDSAVIAYRAPAGDVPVMTLNPKVTTSGGQIDTEMLTDGDLVKTTDLSIAPVGDQSWIQYEFDQPQTIHALTLAMGGARTFFDRRPPLATPKLESSDDGVQFRVGAELKALRHGFAPSGDVHELTIAFAPVLARFFRVSWTTPKPVVNSAIPADTDFPGAANAIPA